MVNKLFTLLFASVLVFPLSTASSPGGSQRGEGSEAGALGGHCNRISKDQSTLTVRNVNSTTRRPPVRTVRRNGQTRSTQ